MARAGLYYLSQKPEKIAPGIETLVRKELAAPTPFQYEVLPGESSGATAGSVLSDIGKSFVPLKSQTTSLFYVRFNPIWPRPFELQVTVSQRGLGALVGPFAYAVPLNKSVQGTVTLGKGRAGFSGDVETSALLNGNMELITQAHRLSVTNVLIGRTRLSISQHLQIVSGKSGSVLIVRRLGKPGFWSGFNVGAKDLFAFVSQLEACLP